MAKRKPAPQDPISADRRRALAELRAAHEMARESGSNPWAYASQLLTLNAEGVKEAALRWLVKQSLAEHRQEVTRPRDTRRSFHLARNDQFTPRSCFCLTPSGLYMAREFAQAPIRAESQTGSEPPDERGIPYFDSVRRTLFLGGFVVKHFRVPAENQELILLAFQEQGWAFRIDDPLPPTDRTDSKKRLHDAIHRLNCRQQHRLIRFHGDGTGAGITWQADDRD